MTTPAAARAKPKRKPIGVTTWAIVDEDGDVIDINFPNRQWAQQVCSPGDRVVRVRITEVRRGTKKGAP